MQNKLTNLLIFTPINIEQTHIKERQQHHHGQFKGRVNECL